MWDYFRYWFGNKNALNTGVTGDKIALQKSGNYQMNYNPFKIMVPNGMPSTVYGGNSYQNNNGSSPNYMSLILIGLGVYLFVEILD